MNLHFYALQKDDHYSTVQKLTFRKTYWNMYEILIISERNYNDLDMQLEWQRQDMHAHLLKEELLGKC